MYVDHNYCFFWPWKLCLLKYSSFTILQHLAIWGNLLGFYIINWIISSVPAAGMYTIMFRLCGQPSYWITMFVSFPTTSCFHAFLLLSKIFSSVIMLSCTSTTLLYLEILIYTNFFRSRVLPYPFPISYFLFSFDSMYRTVIR